MFKHMLTELCRLVNLSECLLFPEASITTVAQVQHFPKSFTDINQTNMDLELLSAVFVSKSASFKMELNKKAQRLNKMTLLRFNP